MLRQKILVAVLLLNEEDRVSYRIVCALKTTSRRDAETFVRGNKGGPRPNTLEISQLAPAVKGLGAVYSLYFSLHL